MSSTFLTHLECWRCGRTFPPEKRFTGCPECARTKPSNLFCQYDLDAIGRTFHPGLLAARPPTLWRYKEFLPAGEGHIVSMGEGMTPLIHCPRLGQRMGLRNLYVKDDSRNPTWSFKDRMAASGAAMALDFGCTVLTAASSGNGGAATSAYAARAGIEAVIFTTPQFPMTMRAFMQAYGTKIVATPTAADRWKMVLEGVLEHDWFPIQNMMTPPVGANPYALEGNKTFAFEVCEQMSWRVPDWVISPCGSGDSLTGAWLGFNQFHRLGYVDRVPRMAAAETYGVLMHALETGADHTEAVEPKPSVAISTATANSAYQCLRTIRDSKGTAMTATNDEIMAAQLSLAACEGIWAEPSSALTIAAIQHLVQRGDIREDDVVVAWLTSGGLKDPEVMKHYLPDIPLIEPTWEALERTLRDTYRWSPA
ncbi:MAG: threonine synthase [Chloroflexota bacterium]|nr:threonine synthase [Chloroflexota bacterium]